MKLKWKIILKLRKSGTFKISWRKWPNSSNVTLASLFLAYRKKNLEENQILIQKKLEAEENYSVLQEKVTFL